MELPITNLIKYSSPGWVKKYTNDIDLKQEMYSHVCRMCRENYSISEHSTLDAMLSTDCGCEFGIDHVEDWELEP